MNLIIPFSVLVVQVLMGLFITMSVSIFLSQIWGAPWVITPHETVKAMLELVEVKPGEKVIDLGAGDGRLLIAAARDFQAESEAAEIDPIRFIIAKYFIYKSRQSNLATVKLVNLFTLNLDDADVVAVYLTRKTNHKLMPHLLNNLKSSARVVSHAFPFVGWTPIIIDEARLIFVYEIDNLGPDVETKFV